MRLFTLVQLRLRHSVRSHAWRFSSTAPVFSNPVNLRLADKAHRHLYRTLETEAKKYRKNSPVVLRPSIRHFLVWLHLNRNQKLDQVVLGNPAFPSPIKEHQIRECAVFHVLVALHCTLEQWLQSQNTHLDKLVEKLSQLKQLRKLKVETQDVQPQAMWIIDQLGLNASETQKSAITKALRCFYLPSKSAPLTTNHDLLAWLRLLQAPTVSEACEHLSNLVEIPAFVTSDILFRTPMSKEELYLQLDIWETFIEPIAKAYHDKTTHTSAMVNNIAYYCVQYDATKLPSFVSATIDFFTSTSTGYTYKLVDVAFANSLLWKLAYYYVQCSSHSKSNGMCLVRAQEPLVKFATHLRLSQEGYMGIVVALSHVSEEKAEKLMEMSKIHFHEHSSHYHMANIYISQTPEQLIHSFNEAIAQYPNSAALWLAFVKKLQAFELLTEARAHKLLKELVGRKNDLIISKDIVLTLLQLVESVNGIETFLNVLDSAGLMHSYGNVVRNKYMALLYRFNKDRNVSKPYLDKFVQSTSNIECARHLYKSTKRKTTANVGTMLNGEVAYQPETIYDLYQSELQGRTPDESCLLALLRAARLRPRTLMWGPMYATQVAVHEFKKNVRQLPESDGFLPSNKLWKEYIRLLESAEYLAELAELIQWWEKVQFVPNRSTLLLLLQALPAEYAERHITHALSVPRDSNFVSCWPWPQVEEFRSLHK